MNYTLKENANTEDSTTSYNSTVEDVLTDHSNTIEDIHTEYKADSLIADDDNQTNIQGIFFIL